MSNIQIFKNENFGEVRVTEVNGEPMFCLVDVCRVLDLSNPRQVRARLADAVISNYPIVDSLGREQNATFINEDALYDVIFDSRKPEARVFRKWVTSDVLPTLRKTGTYSMKSNTPFPTTYAEALRQLADEVEKKERVQLALAEKSIQLDESKQWYSIKRYAKEHNMNWRKISWRALKAISAEHNLEIKKIFDGNYGEVNLYHRKAFSILYGEYS